MDKSAPPITNQWMEAWCKEPPAIAPLAGLLRKGNILIAFLVKNALNLQLYAIFLQKADLQWVFRSNSSSSHRCVKECVGFEAVGQGKV